MTTALYIAASALQSRDKADFGLILEFNRRRVISADFSFGVEKVGGMEYNVGVDIIRPK